MTLNCNTIAAIGLCWLIARLICCPHCAEAWSGRKAVLHARVEAMLAQNLAWKKQDCSAAMWRMLKDLWPELGVTRWFQRTTADAMAGWPWPPVMSLEEMEFGDLIFTGHPKIGHVLMHWDEPETAVHAAKKRGFSLTRLRPVWWPKIELIVRPPY